jgi:hypothetical protein
MAVNPLESAAPAQDRFKRETLSDGVFSIAERVKELREMFQTTRMNPEAPLQVRLGREALQFLVNSPSRVFYIDEISGQKYYQPDHSHLFTVVDPFFRKGGYRGVGLDQKRLFIHPETGVREYYDLLSLIREGESIAGEAVLMPDEESHLKSCFQDQFAKWRYASFQICTFKDLLRLGVEREKAATYTLAIAFYHKKCS